MTIGQTNCRRVRVRHTHGTTVSIEVVVSTGMIDRLDKSPVMRIIHLAAFLLKMLHDGRLISRVKVLSSDWYWPAPFSQAHILLLNISASYYLFLFLGCS